MPETIDPLQSIGDFIQGAGLGKIIRLWLAQEPTSEENERLSEIEDFLQSSSCTQIAQMESQLLQVAARYPQVEVRLRLIALYGVFKVGVVRQEKGHG